MLTNPPLYRETAPMPNTEQELDLDWQVAPEESELWRVLIHNDDVTPMDFVVYVLCHIFDLTSSRAQAVMLKAHYAGLAYVTSLAREEAKYRVGQAHGLARGKGYPLTFTIEPE